MNKRLFLTMLLSVAAMVAVCLSVRSRHAVKMLERDRGEMLAGMDGAAQRIAENAANARLVEALGREAALAKARAFARIVARDPAALDRPGALAEIAADLGVDELHVSDGKGILVHSLPASYRGYDMASQPQSAAFMPAITNASFAFVQEPMAKGIDAREVFQYVGVARRDRPGIVEIGFSTAQDGQIRQLTDVGAIARSTHLGPDTTLSIRPREGLPPPVSGVAHVVENGRAVSLVERDCGEWRLRASHPTVTDWMARERPSWILQGVTLALLLSALLTVVAAMRSLRRAAAGARVSAVRLGRMRSVLVLALFAALMASVFLTVRSRQAVRMLERDRAEMQAGLESVARRIRAHETNDRVIRELNESAGLAKARTFARIVADDPEALERPGEMARIAADLGVTELHVSDAKGVLVHSLPAKYRGYDLSSQAQSAVFMPAVTNAAFALYQEPMLRGADAGEIFRYVGVARRDRPGVVQIGFDVSQRELSNGMDGIHDIMRTAHLGRDCTLTIGPRAGLPPPARGVAHVVENGRALSRVERDFGEWRVCVSHPTVRDWTAREEGFRLLLALDAALSVLLLFAVTSLTRNLRQDFAALRALFSGRFAQKGSLRRAATNPVTLACGAAFLLAIGLTWLSTANASHRAARTRLLAASADMRKMVNECTDNLLFYQGLAIVRHYRRPEAMTCEAVQQIMGRYGLDELNVVDGRGIVLSGALADVGYDMGSKPLTAEFNRLLEGVRTYSQDFRAPVEDPNGEKRKYAGVAFPPPAKGYVQLGFSEKRVKCGIDFWFEDAALNLHIGESGYCIIADNETGEIKSCGRRGFGSDAAADGNCPSLSSAGFEVATAPQENDAFFEATLFGERCLCLSEVKCFHRIICAVPLSEIDGGGRRTVLVSVGALVAVFLLVVFFMSKLTDLVTSLQEKERLERERQLRDLALAKTIQTSSLPVAFPKEPDYKIFASMVTALEVGGDFYDVYARPDGKIVFVVADVSGKGVPAALFMMRAKAILRAAVFERPDSISSAVALANDNLAGNNEAEVFVTAWIGVYDRATGEIAFVNAGHNPPLVKRADGSVEWIRDRGGLVLAAMGGVPYRSGRCRLEKGDSLFLYTDGVTEAMSVKHEQYGEARLETALRRAGRKFVTEIVRDIAAFTTGAEQSDDITMLALDRL